MDVLRLPYGPWKPLLSGKYEGYDVSLYQNPDRDLFSVLVDVDANGNPRGIVVVMYRVFLVDGPVMDLIKGLKMRTIVVTKKAAGDVYQFMLIEEGPKYIGLQREELVDSLNKLGNALYKDTTLVRNVSKAMGIPVTALRDVPKKVAALLLAEPVILPNLMGTPKVAATTDFAKVLPLGKGRDGEVIKESSAEFGRTAILGEHESARKRIFHIILENVLLSGIPAIVVTYNANRYENMNQPGDVSVQNYGITPIGFPRHVWKIGRDYFLDLNFVDMGALAEVLGVDRTQKSFIKLSELIKNKKGDIEKIRDLVKGEKFHKFHDLRARRIVELAERENGVVFGRNNVSSALIKGDVGNVTVLEVKEDLWSPAAVQSLLAGIYEFVAKRGKSKALRAVIFLEDANKIVPRVKSPVTEAIVNIIRELKEYGIGFVAEAKDESEIHKGILELAETTIRTVTEDEVGVRLLTKRPYRVKLRPLASNISE